ncbi:MAG TPA: YggT family protein [Pyrinomonadaceae bacterium]
MLIITRTFLFLTWIVKAAIIAIIALMVFRLIADAANLNPFGWASRTIRRLTDKFVMPARRFLIGFGVDAKFAPLIVILLTILLGWFLLWISEELANTVTGVLLSFQSARPIAAIGFIFYGALSIYSILIFMRIIFSWGMVSYSNRLMRFLVRVTEPLLGPLRRIIPPLGMMDISPLFAFIIIWLFQRAIQGTLLRGV